MLAGRWYSQRLEREVDVVRWGEYGRPVVVFPTAGGAAREIERFLLVDACRDLIDAGNVKLYSLDSVNGRALLANEGDTGRQAWIQRQFFEFVRHELVPAVRADCASEDIELIAAGASIGAFNAVARVCLHPDLFSAAVGMSGTYELRRYFRGPLGDDFTSSSPLEFVPGLGGDHLERLRSRLIILASGEGANENIGESWHLADVLGAVGVPNRVDSWGTQWPHDWPLWRAMLPGYLHDLTSPG